MATTHVPLQGSERKPIAGATAAGPTADSEEFSVTVVLRRKNAIPEDEIFGTKVLTRAEHQEKYGASPTDAAKISEFANVYNLKSSIDLRKRTVELTGTAANFKNAFQVDLNDVKVGEETYRQRTGVINLPETIAPIVNAVVGLDNRPIATPKFRLSKKSVTVPGTFTPIQVAELYNFPPGDGTGQTVAIIELGGGFKQAQLARYFAGLGITPPPTVTAVTVPGGTISTKANSADGEVQLDIEVIGAIVPKANILVYFAGNTNQSFLAAINAAVHDGADVPVAVSISWGSAESNWSAQSLQAFESAIQDAVTLGAVVTVASGDSGSSDGTSTLSVDFPASAPHALATGGTSLKASAGAITSEVVWNSNGGATGGGYSANFAVPPYQNGFVTPPTGTTLGRGVPDVAGDADPDTGYIVSVDGKSTVVGGTSAVAPLYAALVARIAQITGKPVGFLNPQIYSQAVEAAAFHDIVSGNNDATDAGGQYNAAPGWDPTTGLGSPDGAKLLQKLQG